MLTAVYLKVILKTPFLLMTVLEIPKSCTPLFYTRPKHLFNRLNKPPNFRSLQGTRRTVWTNPGLKQGFICIDITDTADETLI